MTCVNSHQLMTTLDLIYHDIYHARAEKPVVFYEKVANKMLTGAIFYDVSENGLFWNTPV